MQPQVEAKYVVVGVRPGKYNFKGFGEIDLRELTLSRADDLYKRNFPHLRLREGAVPARDLPPQKVRKINMNLLKKEPEAPKEEAKPEHDLLPGKKLVNSLLVRDWTELTTGDKELFFYDEKYFTQKKNMLIRVSEIDRKMQGIHARVKAIADDNSKEAKRGELMIQLSDLELEKLDLFSKIDDWSHEGPAIDADMIAAKAAEEALAKQKLIAAHENYIFRYEPMLKDMAEETKAQKSKKDKLIAEIERRKQELITIGKPYQRKSRKNG